TRNQAKSLPRQLIRRRANSASARRQAPAASSIAKAGSRSRKEGFHVQRKQKKAKSRSEEARHRFFLQSRAVSRQAGDQPLCKEAERRPGGTQIVRRADWHGG